MRQGVYLRGELKGAGKPRLRSLGKGDGNALPLITWIRPETDRSNPGQDEAPRQGGGSPLEFLSSTRFRDLGIGVKCQSRSVIAGSFRNGSQSILTRGRTWGRALIG